LVFLVDSVECSKVIVLCCLVFCSRFGFVN